MLKNNCSFRVHDIVITHSVNFAQVLVYTLENNKQNGDQL